MNTELLVKLAEWLEAGAPHERITFDMNEGIVITDRKFDPDKDIATCNTSCCLAGAAVMLFNKPQALKDHIVDEGDFGPFIAWQVVHAEARDVLDLDYEQSRKLFEPSFFFKYDDLQAYNDPAWAARTVRHLIETGVVDWNATEVKAVEQ